MMLDRDLCHTQCILEELHKSTSVSPQRGQDHTSILKARKISVYGMDPRSACNRKLQQRDACATGITLKCHSDVGQPQFGKV